MLRIRNIEDLANVEKRNGKYQLQDADLSGAILNGVNLNGANLSGANLNGAHLNSAYLNDADLQGAHLRGVDLIDAHLKRAILIDADLQGGALLIRAKLQGAYLTGAKLQRANLNHAKLIGAHLSGVKLQGAFLNEANLTDADLSGKYLEEVANLTDAYLTDANLTDAILEGIILNHAILNHADLLNAKLQGAELQHAKLQDAYLHRADLRGANLEHAILHRADLRGANFYGAILDDADLRGADLQFTRFSNVQVIRTNLTGVNLDVVEDIRGTNLVNAIGIESEEEEEEEEEEQDHINDNINPYQIHQAFTHILKKKDRIIELLSGNDQGNYDMYFNDNKSKFSNDIVEKLLLLCSTSGDKEVTINNYEGHTKTNHIQNFLVTIINKFQRSDVRLNAKMKDVNGVEYDVTMRDFLFAIFKFIKRRTPDFKHNYINFFIQDCLTAYNGPIGEGSLSCVNGILERFLTSISQTLVDVDTEQNDIDTIENLNEINEIIRNTKNMKKILEEFAGKCNEESTDKESFTKCMIDTYIKDYNENEPIDDITKSEIVAYCDIHDIIGGKKRKTKKRRSKKGKTNKQQTNSIKIKKTRRSISATKSSSKVGKTLKNNIKKGTKK